MMTSIFMIVASFSALTHAQDVNVLLTHIDSKLVECRSQSMSEETTRMCYFQSYENANKILNSILISVRLDLSKQEIEYKKTGSFLNVPESQQISLVLSQEGWEKYREGHCELLATENYGGSNASNIRNECLYRMTKQRLIEVARKFKF